MLVVNDFLIKRVNKADLQHSRETMKARCAFKVDGKARQHGGIHLKWDCAETTVRLLMDGHVKQALIEFKHEAPKTPCCAPPTFGAKVQKHEVVLAGAST